MKILHLTLKKKWFDMIASGEKKEEYREKRTFWCRRLVDGYSESEKNGKIYFSLPAKKFDAVHFVNGGNFHPKHPSITMQCLGIELREGRPEWGAEPGTTYFVIKLGERIQ